MAVEEASVDPDPMTQLSSWLAAARAAGESMPEAMAVATATTEGRPSSRMVLLRGIDHRGLVFYTDQESGKGQELEANPFAAALFHWFKPGAPTGPGDGRSGGGRSLVVGRLLAIAAARFSS